MVSREQKEKEHDSINNIYSMSGSNLRSNRCLIQRNIRKKNLIGTAVIHHKFRMNDVIK
jgi:hypothetical protein